MVWEGRTGGKGHPAKIDAENILKIRLVVFITERHNPPPSNWNLLLEEQKICFNLFDSPQVLIPVLILISKVHTSAGNCMFKVNNRNTRTRCEVCSKLTIKAPKRP